VRRASGLTAVVGGLGSGKSFLTGLIVVAAIVGIAVFADWEHHRRAGSVIVLEAETGD